MGSLGNKRKSASTGGRGLSKPEYADDGARRMPGLGSAYSNENARQKIMDTIGKSGRTCPPHTQG